MNRAVAAALCACALAWPAHAEPRYSTHDSHDMARACDARGVVANLRAAAADGVQAHAVDAAAGLLCARVRGGAAGDLAGQGTLLDGVAARLAKAGVSAYRVQAGAVVRTGPEPGAKPWFMAVAHPAGGDRPNLAQFPLDAGEVSIVSAGAHAKVIAVVRRQVPSCAACAVREVTALRDLPIEALLAQAASAGDVLLVDAADRWQFGGAMRARIGRGVPAQTPAPPAYQAFRAPIMSTAIDVQVPSGPDAQRLADGVFAIFREVDVELNEWKEGTPIATINREAGKHAVAVSAHVRQMLREARIVSERTGGAFDVTWAALWGLWDFSETSARKVADARQIAQRLPLINWRKVEIDETAGTVRLPTAGMKLGVGGIAKGWALAQAGRWLREQGVTSYSLSAGGQVLVAGLHGDRPWRVGIRNPRGGPDDVLTVLDVRDASLSTSGDYEHFFEVDGVRYHHIIDVHTGLPARGLRSATVVTADATLADGLSTALMVLGRAKALALVASWPGVECALVDDTGKLWLSKGLRAKADAAQRPPAGAP